MLIQVAPLHLGNRIREAFVDAFHDFAVARGFSHADDPPASTARKNRASRIRIRDLAEAAACNAVDITASESLEGVAHGVFAVTPRSSDVQASAIGTPNRPLVA